MTFSITGRCATTGMLGLAVTSSSVCVASRCAWARAGVGAVSTQNITDPRLGRRALELMAGGLDAPAALEEIKASAPNLAYRQLALIDRDGRTAHFSGAKTLGTHAVAEGRDCIAAGNLLTNPGVPAAMIAAFEGAQGRHLAERLLLGLEAGLGAGGEEGPVKSAGILVVHEQDWPLVELREDWREADAIPALREAWRVYEPQIDDYLTRALDPDAAPSYGVPGDL